MTKVIRKRILRGCYSFLIPVARFLLRSGVSFREFEEIAKIAFVQVASQDYGLRGRLTNASRVSVMTGINRKEVQRVRSLASEYHTSNRTELSPLSDLLHHWYTDEGLQDSNGMPIPLRYSGGDVSFETLVKRCAGDVPVGAMKVELIRSGAVVEDEKRLLHAMSREFIPSSFDEKLLSSISYSLSFLASTIAFNTDPERRAPPRIERNVQSDRIGIEFKEKLKQLLNHRLTGFTEELDDLLAAAEARGSGETTRIAVGVYYYEDD